MEAFILILMISKCNFSPGHRVEEQSAPLQNSLCISQNRLNYVSATNNHQISAG